MSEDFKIKIKLSDVIPTVESLKVYNQLASSLDDVVEVVEDVSDDSVEILELDSYCADNNIDIESLIKSIIMSKVLDIAKELSLGGEKILNLNAENK